MTKRILCVLMAMLGTLIAVVSVHVEAEQERPHQLRKDMNADIPKEIAGKDSARMVLIPAGEFQMGSNNGKDAEQPVHAVYVDTFYMDKYEVTNAQYRRFIQGTGHKEPEGRGLRWEPGFKPLSDKNFGADDQPVVCITWEDARAYAEWAGKRLPTEAEWEKAARGGLVGAEYAWGDDWPPPKGAGNLCDEAGMNESPRWICIPGYDDDYIYPAPVGSFKPNGYGLYDIVGNVRELCADWYDSDYYAKSPVQNPKGPSSGVVRVLRGGGWSDYNAYNLRVARRCHVTPDFRYTSYGFRCALSVVAVK